MKKRITFLFLLLVLFNSVFNISYAENNILNNQILTNETVAVEIPVETLSEKPSKKKINKKIIRLNKVYLDQQDEKKLDQRAEKIESELLIKGINEMPKDITEEDFDVDLKMNDVPVLDQGPYGTCSTFAVTAALNAIKQRGDYISQQCLLELGNTYENNNYYSLNNDSDDSDDFDDNDNYNYCNSSGWKGFDNKCLLSRIQRHGIVSKNNCPHSYPLEAKSDLTTASLSFDEYNKLGQGEWSKDFTWRKLRNPNSTFDAKRALNNGHRILIGTMMNIESVRATIGYPVNGKKAALWALPRDVYGLEEFVYEVKNSSIGHAMIITGYSDKKQVFKIRNSWGSLAGDNGDYYMTYDYYRMLNVESIEIGGII